MKKIILILFTLSLIGCGEKHEDTILDYEEIDEVDSIVWDTDFIEKSYSNELENN